MNLILVFLLFCSSCAFAQQPGMWQITDEQGLPSLTVYDIYQDGKGYIWFGTETGICRYDGNKFKTFAINNSKGKAITSIREDSHGNIWFSNFSGQLFYLNNEKVVQLEIPEYIKASSLIVYSIDKESNILIGAEKLYSYHQQTKVWTGLELPDNNTEILVNNIESDISRGNDMWIEAGNSIFTYNGNQIDHIFNMPLKKQRSRRMAIIGGKVLFVDQEDDAIFYYEDNKFQRLDFLAVTSGKNGLIYPRTDEDENVWICTRNGLFGFDKNFNPIHNGLKILPDRAISDVYKDREGNYWISTLGEGVYVIPNMDLMIYSKTNSNLSSDVIQCMDTDEENNLILGLNNGSVEAFSSKEQKVVHRYLCDTKKDVEGIYFDKQSKILYVSCGCLLGFQKNESHAFFRSFCDSPKLLSEFQNNLIVSSSWVGYAVNIKNSIAVEPALTEKFHTHFEKNTKYYKENAKITSSVVAFRFNRSRATWGEKNRFWIAYAEGLFYYEDGEEHEFKNEKKQPIYGRSFIQTDDGTLWVGTLDDGLYAIKNLEIVQHLGTKNGLVSNHCRSLATVGTDIWIGMDKGVNYIDLKTNVIELFNRQDGLMPNEILDLKIINDKLWIATGKGLFSIPKNGFFSNKTPPMIYINNLKVWGISDSKKDYYELKYNQNNILIEFQGLAYRSRGIFKYKYRMIGLDSTWITTESSSNFARFPSLPPGRYEFQVKAINEDGLESEGTALLEIVVLPPFWQTWWFNTLVVLSIVLFISLIFVSRIRSIQRKNKIKQDLRSSQLSSLKAQMNPHFIFNALNSIQEFILQNDKLQANRFLGKFADLMRLTLDSSNETEISLTDELKILGLYLELESLRFEEDFTYQIIVDEDADTQNCKIPAMLIQPYLENAIKHGLLHKKTDRRLSISFKISNEKDILFCKIEDNGIGRKKSEEIKKGREKNYKSFAMSANQKRLELLNYGRKNQIHVEIIDLYDAHQQATGTIVCLNIPLV